MSITHSPHHILTEKSRTPGSPPPTPTSIDGASLSADQRTRLGTLIRIIWQADRLRSPDAIVRQATAGFLRSVRRRGQEYDDLPFYHLGPNGTGPVIWPAGK